MIDKRLKRHIIKHILITYIRGLESAPDSKEHLPRLIELQNWHAQAADNAAMANMKMDKDNCERLSLFVTECFDKIFDIVLEQAATRGREALTDLDSGEGLSELVQAYIPSLKRAIILELWDHQKGTE
ncbi:hypothetical protein JKY72_01510 [Candidatus Gracilibacteria bacterium]|nr:hypothetical protein [Candidatus Gracilibacteria bacterium]